MRCYATPSRMAKIEKTAIPSVSEAVDHWNSRTLLVGLTIYIPNSMFDKVKTYTYSLTQQFHS